jgi:replication factor C subunit 1
VKEGRGWNAAGSINSKAALLSGDPGIGKTTTARLIAARYNYKITEFNASDVRNKSGIDLLPSSYHSLNISNTETMLTKRLIIMDEVDGMSSGDRGGINAIINMIKNTKAPIICICNDRSCDKIRSLAGHCLDIKFQKPQKSFIITRLKSILSR